MPVQKIPGVTQSRTGKDACPPPGPQGQAPPQTGGQTFLSVRASPRHSSFLGVWAPTTGMQTRGARKRRGSDADDDLVVVIAADTTVDVDGLILAKPVDAEDAFRMLRLLSGRTHSVHTGVAVRRGDLCESAVTTTRVTMSAIDDAHLRWYVATGEPFGKAGAYALQGAGSLLVERVDGSVSNVIGLPLATLDELLGRLGVSLVALANHAD